MSARGWMPPDVYKRQHLILYACGIIPVVWLALLLAPYMGGGLAGLVRYGGAALDHPFHIVWCEGSLKTVLIFLLCYALGIGVYLSTDRNYRRREEHGSARWGDPKGINRKYADKELTANKILTQNVAIGLDGRRHRRNLNVLVVGGSGAGKTRFYAKPNIMNANTSLIVLDCKGEILRDTGGLLEANGYDIKVLDLINMEKSHCYNPFAYLRNDNDIQRLVTNLFKNTTPKGAQSQDPFWDQAAQMLLLALVFYLHYEAPPEERNFSMVMEMIRAGEVREDDDTYQSPLDELFDRLEDVYKRQPVLIQEVRRVGNNLNQIMKRANALGLLDVPQLRKELEDNRAVEKLIADTYTAVSYTHLDVYKRQAKP